MLAAKDADAITTELVACLKHVLLLISFPRFGFRFIQVITKNLKKCYFYHVVVTATFNDLTPNNTSPSQELLSMADYKGVSNTVL